MDKSKGVPVISVKTLGSKERVSILFLPGLFISFDSSLCVLGDS